MTEHGQARHRCSILVVDDDPDLQGVLRLALTADGYDVDFASDGRAALDYLRSHVDTCGIVLDLMLPGMDGAEFRARQLRDRSIAWIPVVVTSATIDAERYARSLGAVRLLRKPFDLDDLRKTVSAISRNCRKADRTDELAGA